MSENPSAAWNPGEDEWVITVPGRANLPAKADTHPGRRQQATCPFCPGSQATPDPYDVRVVASRYPAVHGDAAGGDVTTYGQHSVYLYTADHRGRLVDQGLDRVVGLFEVIATETSRFLEDPKVEAVFGFETSGDHFGPTVDHPHGQLIGFSFTPRRQTLTAAACVICAAATQDHMAPYVVCSGEGAFVFVPPFARLPFEMWVVPHRHVGRMADLRPDEITDLATMLLLGLRGCLDDDGVMPQYLLTIMQAPRPQMARHHLRLELVPLHRPAGGMKRPGGVELGAGIHLNPLAPADAAAQLRHRLDTAADADGVR